MVSLVKFLKEKRWALFAIIFATLVGFSSAIICIAWNLVIFGFNIMYIISPLIAGFIETFIARRRYGKSTGAISALLTFMIINGYGWFGPGYIFPKEPFRLSLITIIAIVLTLQAAFPTLINYILFVVGIGTVRKFIEFLIFIPSRIQRKIPVTPKREETITPSTDEIFLDELPVPLLSVPPVEERKIIKYVGLVAGEGVAKEKEAEGRVSKLTKIIEPTLLDDIYLGEAREVAISRMLYEAKSLGADTVIDVLIDYVSMGGLQGSALLVTAIGTAVIVNNLEKKTSETGHKSRLEGKEVSDVNKKFSSDEERIPGKNKKNNVHRVIEKISGRPSSISGMKKEINVSKANEDFPSIIDRIKVSSQIIGKEVIDSTAIVVGKVKDLEINLENNEIEAVILSKGGASQNLGLSKDESIIPYDKIVQIGDRILIKDINTDIENISDYNSYLERKIRNIKV